jgi:hypothetical protein
MVALKLTIQARFTKAGTKTGTKTGKTSKTVSKTVKKSAPAKVRAGHWKACARDAWPRMMVMAMLRVSALALIRP